MEDLDKIKGEFCDLISRLWKVHGTPVVLTAEFDNGHTEVFVTAEVLEDKEAAKARRDKVYGKYPETVQMLPADMQPDVNVSVVVVGGKGSDKE